MLIVVVVVIVVSPNGETLILARDVFDCHGEAIRVRDRTLPYREYRLIFGS